MVHCSGDETEGGLHQRIEGGALNGSIVALGDYMKALRYCIWLNLAGIGTLLLAT